MKPGWWLFCIAHAALIWWFSSQAALVAWPAPWDKLLHLPGFALLGFLSAKATGNVRHGFLIAVLYGALDEVHQAFVPSRQADLTDWIADLLGALAGALLAHPVRSG